MVDLTAITVTVAVTYHEARALRSAAGSKIGKRTRDSKRIHQPKPGQIDKNAAEVETLTSASEKVDQAITAAIAAAKRGD